MSTIKLETQQGAGGGGSVSKDYVDERDLIVTNTVEAYADAKDTALETTLKNYTDGKTTALSGNAVTDVTTSANASTVTLTLAEKNLGTGTTSTVTRTLPVASATEAGVMNTALYATLASHSENINAILNGAVSITGLPASPTQNQLSDAWKTATGISSVINGAKINDPTNSKVWTYYTNTETWYPATNTAQVVVNTWTNNSLGIAKGSTEAGKIYAETDGTGSVNGWDALNSTVSGHTTALGALNTTVADHTSAITILGSGKVDKVTGKGLSENDFTTALKNKLDGIASGAEVNVQSNWTQTNTSADDYIKNKPTIPTVNNATLTIKQNNSSIGTFTANASSNKTISFTTPVITVQSTDPGEGATLAADNFIAVYEV